MIAAVVFAVIGRSLLLPRTRASGTVAGFLALFVLAGSTIAADPVDMRGSWACVASVGSTRYPQTIKITSENFTTGRIAGTDVGGGMTFRVTGTVTGNRFTMVVSKSGYTSRSSGTVRGTLPHLSFSGSFSDSNNARGPFTCKMTKAVATPKPSAAASAPAKTPIATAPGNLPSRNAAGRNPAGRNTGGRNTGGRDAAPNRCGEPGANRRPGSLERHRRPWARWLARRRGRRAGHTLGGDTTE